MNKDYALGNTEGRPTLVCISIFALRLMKIHELHHLQTLLFIFKCLL